MSSTLSQADQVRRRVLRVHGTFLLILTPFVTAVTLIGWRLGKGPFAMWQQQPFAAVGLFQAYLLMFVIGIVLWLGSSLDSNLWKWDLVGFLAHVPPLAANVIFFGLFTSDGFQRISVASMALHGVWMLVELFAVLFRGRSSAG
jgi:hypothetical protein